MEKIIMSNLEIDPNKEYVLAGDISASMTTIDPACGDNPRYTYMLEKFESFIKAAEDFDQHGAATIMLFGERVHTYRDAKLSTVTDKLQQVNFEGFTNTDLCIKAAYELHKSEKREMAREKKVHPGTVLLIFTDGAATNRAAVQREIIRIANEIDREDEFTIQFLTVGTIDGNLKAFLQGLHDDLEDHLTQDFDIVHVDKLEDVNFLAVTSGALRHANN
jgi:hypothetical protein